jgi:flagellar biosynthesis component FlhA
MEYREMLHRYVGRRVCVSTFGHSKLWGELAAVNEDCVRLVNTMLSSDSEDQWLTQSYSDPDNDYGVRHAETIVHFHHIVAITCLDDDIAELRCETRDDTRCQHQTTGTRQGDEGSRVFADDVFQHLRLERLEVLIGRGLIPLADPKRPGGLPERMVALRNQIGAQLGFVLPAARLRDDSRLGEHEYRMFINGTEVVRGLVRPDKLLAVGEGSASTKLEGERTLEPIYAQTAMWVAPTERDAAEQAGYVLVEPAAVLATHLQNQTRRHAHELLSLDGLRLLLDHLRQTSPAVVEELVPARISLSRLHDLLCRLLEEEVPLRPLERILERIAHLPSSCDDIEQMLAALRTSIGRILCDRFRDGYGQLPLASLDRELSDRLADVLLEMEQGSGIWLARLIDGLRTWYLDQRTAGRDLPLVVDTPVRRRLHELLAHQIPGLAVLAYSEVPHELPVQLAVILSPQDLGLKSPEPKGQPNGKRRKPVKSEVLTTAVPLAAAGRRRAPR